MCLVHVQMKPPDWETPHSAVTNPPGPQLRITRLHLHLARVFASHSVLLAVLVAFRYRPLPILSHRLFFPSHSHSCPLFPDIPARHRLDQFPF